MKKRLFDIGQAVYAVCTAQFPSNYLAFNVFDADGVQYDIHGFPRLVVDFGWLNLSIASDDARATLADLDGLFVCAYKPLLAFCAQHIKDRDIDEVCRLHEEVRLPTAFKADRILKELGVPSPKCVEEGDPVRLDLSDPRLAKRVAERVFTDPFSDEAMQAVKKGA